MMKKKLLSRTVIILGFVSFLNDISSEMLIPVMPVYLASIGYSVLWIGIIEGVAEAVAGITKSYFGNYSDRLQSRIPFVRSGYILSSIAKPMLILFRNPGWVLFSRTTERLGKGIRTGARDAILSAESDPADRGKVFGFHKSMDTLGAALGPVVALIYLEYFPGRYEALFLIAFLPALFGSALTFLIKEPKIKTSVRERPSLKDSFTYWSRSGVSYKKLIAGLLLFTLFNSSDAFLLLKMKKEGLSDTWVLSIYIFFNLVSAALSYPAGMIADKAGMKKILITGMLLFSAVYLGMGYSTELWHFFVLFGIYGFYTAMTDGISKAWITVVSDKSKIASAIGFYTGAASIVTLVASSAAGVIWTHVSAQAVFLFACLGSLFTVAYFVLVVKAPGYDK